MRVRHLNAMRGIHPEVAAAIPTIAGVWQHFGQRILTITHGPTGEHSPGSLHYLGYALDLRIHGIPEGLLDSVVAMLREDLGPDWQVINEGTHIHCECHPQTALNSYKWEGLHT